MKKLILKIAFYLIAIIALLELMVRAFHLHTDDPPRYIDKFGVEKRVPGHNGYSVTGNRNQTFSAFKINKEGFNSFREFSPTKDGYEIAIIGDSFIEGFHIDYTNSIGKKIEDNLKYGEVYEYGYAGYDLANQMHLIYSNKEQFDLIDEIIIYLNFQNDLKRNEYVPNTSRIALLSSLPFKIRDNIKLLSYASGIGVLDPIKTFFVKKLPERKAMTQNSDDGIQIAEKISAQEEKVLLENFKDLITLYGFDKTKTSILLDKRETGDRFLAYCNQNDINIIDFSTAFSQSKKPTTLIYDWHWNEHGRDLIAKEISDYIKKRK
ncbi:hypothetical protein [Flagellimonas sp.]|uniref:hypothetical protein n=1 Tax=Flagellimonas sp. TaxID=2058762 RepID=UPI003B590525